MRRRQLPHRRSSSRLYLTLRLLTEEFEVTRMAENGGGAPHPAEAECTLSLPIEQRYANSECEGPAERRKVPLSSIGAYSSASEPGRRRERSRDDENEGLI